MIYYKAYFTNKYYVVMVKKGNEACSCYSEYYPATRKGEEYIKGRNIPETYYCGARGYEWSIHSPYTRLNQEEHS
jgi:hypothetical protein